MQQYALSIRCGVNPGVWKILTFVPATHDPYAVKSRIDERHRQYYRYASENQLSVLPVLGIIVAMLTTSTTCGCRFSYQLQIIKSSNWLSYKLLLACYLTYAVKNVCLKKYLN